MAHLFDRSAHPPQRLPARTGTFAMIWFLGTLAMLFGASLLGYIAIRLQRAWPDNVDAVVPQRPIPIGSLHFPATLWLSTALVLAASVTIQLAVNAVQRERQAQLRRWTLVTLALGAVFCLVQGPTLWQMLSGRMAEMAATPTQGDLTNALYKLAFVLILLHAVHVVGGLIHLVIRRPRRAAGAYDHESHGAVTHAAMYWHFLDFVWLLMFATIFLAG